MCYWLQLSNNLQWTRLPDITNKTTFFKMVNKSILLSFEKILLITQAHKQGGSFSSQTAPQHSWIQRSELDLPAIRKRKSFKFIQNFSCYVRKSETTLVHKAIILYFREVKDTYHLLNNQESYQNVIQFQISFRKEINLIATLDINVRVLRTDFSK